MNTEDKIIIAYQGFVVDVLEGLLTFSQRLVEAKEEDLEGEWERNKTVSLLISLVRRLNRTLTTVETVVEFLGISPKSPEGKAKMDRLDSRAHKVLIELSHLEKRERSIVPDNPFVDLDL